VTRHLGKPSVRRALCSIVTVALIACVVTGIALAAGFVHGHNDNGAIPDGEYVRLVVTALTIWGPMYLLIASKVSVPVIVAVGSLAACVRLRPVGAGADSGESL
jgi:hypothetical protein